MTNLNDNYTTFSYGICEKYTLNFENSVLTHIYLGKLYHHIYVFPFFLILN